MQFHEENRLHQPQLLHLEVQPLAEVGEASLLPNAREHFPGIELESNMTIKHLAHNSTGKTRIPIAKF